MAIRRNKRTNTANSKAARERQAKKLQAIDAKNARKETIQKVIIVVFAALMALSILLPSLASIFGRSASPTQTIESLQDIDEMYGPVVENAKAALQGDEENFDKLNDVARYYLEWASYASYFAGEGDTDHVVELYDEAIAYFDRALKVKDDPGMHVDRIVAQFYRDSTAGVETATTDAVAAMEEYLQGDGAEYAPGWMRMGMLYEYAGDQEQAKAAFERAAELDPDDEQGIKTAAEQEIAALNGEVAADSGMGGNGAGDLQGQLSDATGTGV